MDTAPVTPKWRRFQVRSEFGRPRQWRSRKSRPCDACRRRKTACVITTRPPCRYCQSKGLVCQATTDSSVEKAPEESREPAQVLEEVPEEAVHGIASPDAVSVLSPPWTVVPDEASLSVHVTTPEDVVASSVSSVSSVPVVPLSTPVGPAILTLEDNPNQTAHSMGLAGEQDTGLLVSFRSVVINEVNRVDADIIQIWLGDPDLHRPPVHFSLLHDEFAPLDNVAKQAASDRIEAAVQGCADELVRLYFRHVHPVYPVLSKTRFLRAYSVDRTALPASLRGAVYGLATNFWGAEGETDERPSPFCAPQQHELFEAALAALQREMHGPHLGTLQACLLLIHENPADNATIETPRVWTLCAQAVACAQMLGLHRDPSAWHLSVAEKHLRKKLWWATLAADVWASVCHGNPPHVYPASFTTAPLTMDDVRCDEVVPHELQHLVDASSARLDVVVCARFAEMVSLSCLVHELLLSSFSDVAYAASMQDPLSREAGLLALRERLCDWASLLPRCLNIDSSQTADLHAGNNAPVHLAFFAAVALHFRALMSPVTKAAKQDPTSSLRRFFSQAIQDFSPFIDFMHEISPECLHAFWGLYARSQLILCGNFLIYLFLLAPDPVQVQDTFQLLGRFHDSLQRLSAVADKVAISLLRPVALRIDSFFTQAAQTMRTAQAAQQ